MPEAAETSARAVHGLSAGADVAVLLGPGSRMPTADLAAALAAGAPGCRIVPVPVPETVPEAVPGPTDGRDAGGVPTGAVGSASPWLVLSRAASASPDRPLFVLDGTVSFADPPLPSLLDLLDRPGAGTETLLVAPGDPEAPPVGLAGLPAATPARVGADGRLVESSGSPRHRVGDPNRAVVGALRVDPADRAEAARLWGATEAALPADPTSATDPGATDPGATFDLALLTLVRGGLPVGARAYGYYRWRRGIAGQTGAAGTGWRQRLRTASRGGDGLYSTAVVRRLSRHGTAVALGLGWSPNLVTAASLLIGLLAAALVYTGAWWAWVLAAVLLQVALVVDCMDGEIARFTRRFSNLGGWLDGVGDRVKEYAVFAAVAAVAVRDGHPDGWLWAAIALVLVTGRHLEDHSYADKLAPGRLSRPERLGLDVVDDSRAAAGARTGLTGRPDRRARTVFWAKKVVHLPIAERYLLLSLLLLTRQPLWVLAVAVVGNALALLWALGGRVLRELRRPSRDLGPELAAVGPLDAQLDLGLSVRLLQRVWRWRGPFLPGVVALLALWLGVIACVCAGLGWLALVGAVVGVPLLAATAQPPVRHRFGWLLPPLLWAGEAAVVAALLAHGRLGGAVFGFLAVVAYRRYDLIYGLRLRTRATAALDPLAGLGVEGRVLLVALLVLLVAPAGGGPTAPAPSGLVTGLVFGMVLVGLPAALASVREWRSAGR
ncbi:hypothetical protein FHX74_001150 [Friedmanniella endophytica]|uniref:DUF5941 domain-containing protein n=1 Tax=Microlunatus kandeliicorticis TaxID=1759536 RepID=A0A7W3P561_9ACTN|nr:DUF5941 domain-containing protein [Microlunatus kandeliicorticis]MBA8793545.1 hypothetical protein [Microlunatus kandeliicorticis]